MITPTEEDSLLDSQKQKKRFSILETLRASDFHSIPSNNTTATTVVNNNNGTNNTLSGSSFGATTVLSSTPHPSSPHSSSPISPLLSVTHEGIST